MADFTKLEWQTFAAIYASYPTVAAPLQQLLDTAQLTDRDNTGYGFYTNFDVDRTLPPIEGRMWISVGLYIRVKTVTIPMSFILWYDSDGYPTCLEGWQAGDEEVLVDLKQYDLASLESAEPKN